MCVCMYVDCLGRGGGKGQIAGEELEEEGLLHWWGKPVYEACLVSGIARSKMIINNYNNYNNYNNDLYY